jgi:hypothetical protein
LETRSTSSVTPGGIFVAGEVVNGNAPVADVVVLYCTAEEGPALLFKVSGVLGPGSTAPFYFASTPIHPDDVEIVAFGAPAGQAPPTDAGFELTIEDERLIPSDTPGRQPTLEFRIANLSNQTAVAFNVWITVYDEGGEVVWVFPVAMPEGFALAPGQQTIPLPVLIPDAAGAMSEGSTATVRAVGFSQAPSEPPADAPVPIEE